MNKNYVGLISLSVLISQPAYADRLEPGSPLFGYQCYHVDAERLKLTPGDLWVGKGMPPVLNGPSVDSGKLGVAPGVVYVAWPLQRQNGFVRTLRVGGQLGWISEDVIRPLYRAPGSTGGCTLSWRGDRVQFHLDPGAKAWFFPDGHDIPKDKLR